MQLLLLRVDETAKPLLTALRSTGRHRISGWHQSDSIHDWLSTQFPGGTGIANVDEFSKMASNNAVLVGERQVDSEDQEQLLRELARDGVPLILMQPACSGIFAFELDMIQRDTVAPMIPVHPACRHELLDTVAASLQTSNAKIGTVEQIVVERQMDDRSDEAVRAALSRDAMLLRRLIGDFHKIGAMQSSGEPSLANLSVHLTSAHSAITRWSVGPVLDQPGATLQLIGTEGRVALEMPNDGPWQLKSTDPSIEQDAVADVWDSVVEHIDAGMAGQPSAPTWEDAVRAIDLSDTASECIRRGKTLTLNNERLTEEDTFKSMMAAGGCLIIMVLPVLLLLVSLVDGMNLPYNKTTVVEAVAEQRSVPLPPDLNALKSIVIPDGRELTPMTEDELFRAYGLQRTGTPEAYCVERNEFTIAPVPDENILLELQYEGAFNIWRGWPFLLLAPIAFFLALQLFKLAFPKPGDPASAKEAP